MRIAHAILLASCLLTVSLLGACDADRHPSRAHAATPAPDPSSLGPIKTLELMRKHRADRAYDAIGPFLLDRQRDIVIAQIRAVDRLIDATNLLRTRIGEHMGLASAQEFDFEEVVNILGVLSRDVTPLAEEVDGHRARVSFQVADRVPLESVDMVRRDDRWLLVADPIAGVPEALRDLAALTEQIAHQIPGTIRTAGRIRRELNVRQAPILRRLADLVRQSASHRASLTAHRDPLTP